MYMTLTDGGCVSRVPCSFRRYGMLAFKTTWKLVKALSSLLAKLGAIGHSSHGYLSRAQRVRTQPLGLDFGCWKDAQNHPWPELMIGPLQSS